MPKIRRTSKKASKASPKELLPKQLSDERDLLVVPPEVRSPESNSIEASSSNALFVGHQPRTGLAPQDRALFRSFQSNLLSLISHELRTPLMGILNAVTLLDEEGATSGSGGDSQGLGISTSELVRMARQNAQRLQRSLTLLLDLAALESRTFHARLRETELQRLVRGRLEQVASVLRDREMTYEEVRSSETLALADPQKMARAVDLCLEGIIFRARKGSALKVRISSKPAPQIAFEFELEAGMESTWEQAWTHGLAGFGAGVGSPTSAFAGVLQAEEAFLTRTEEGLGAEFILLHEIMRLHQGKLECEREGARVMLRLRIPDLSSDEALRVVLTSRAYELSTEPTSVALILIRVPKGRELAAFQGEVRKSLYRTTDSVYSLPQRAEVAVVMDEYPREDLPKFMKRLEGGLKLTLEAVMVHCPGDVADPTLLWERAKSQMAEIK